MCVSVCECVWLFSRELAKCWQFWEYLQHSIRGRELESTVCVVRCSGEVYCGPPLSDISSVL